jgi:hypothetical protein
MNSRKTSGAPGKHQDLAPDNGLAVLCGNHAGTPASLEKPRIWWSGDFQEWVCWLDNHPTYPDEDVVGFGDSPQKAYSNWCAGMLTSEAQALGLYAAPQEAQ